ncbi:MAG: hypothetical protein U1E46_07660 [Hyphomicrobiales bacterium]
MSQPFRLVFFLGLLGFGWWWVGSACYSALTSLPPQRFAMAIVAVISLIWAINLRDLYPHEKKVALGLVVAFLLTGTLTVAYTYGGA